MAETVAALVKRVNALTVRVTGAEGRLTALEAAPAPIPVPPVPTPTPVPVPVPVPPAPGTPVSISVAPTSVQPGQLVTVTFTNESVGQSPGGDWIGLYTSAASVYGALDHRYLNGLVTPPAAVLASGSFEFPMPTTAGTYELRFVRDGVGGIRTVLASATVTVVGAPNPQPVPIPTPTPVPTPTPIPPPVGGTVAELPRVYIDSRYVAPGQSVVVPTGADLQKAIDAAPAGSGLLLAAGATYVGNFVMPAKSQGLTIRTDTNLPPEGKRVTPQTAAAFAKIISPNSAPAIRFAPGAHHYRPMGLEIAYPPAVLTGYTLVAIGDGMETTAAELPHHVVLDRVYIHGHDRMDFQRGVGLNCGEAAIVDSHISDCHGKGFEAQAILCYNGTGPFKIVNDYLEGAGENLMFGGADTSIPNNVPSDIELRGCHFFKPLAWRGVWTVKNLFELKNARRVLVEGNVMENNWADAQTGFGVLFTPRNQNGTNPWAAVQDVTFRKNLVISENGMNILGTDDLNPSQTTSRILVENNLFDIAGTNVQVLRGVVDAQIVHNTLLGTDRVLFFAGEPTTRFVFRDNVSHYGAYGIYGDAIGVGLVALEAFAPSADVRNNLFFAGQGFGAIYYPASTRYSPSNPLDATYRLPAGSAFRGKASDGTDPGADIDALNAATAGVVP